MLSNCAYRVERALEYLEARCYWLLAFFSCFLLGVMLIFDWKRPIWNDELFTYYIARQPTLAAVRNVLSTGAEQLPIFYFAIVRLFTSLLGSQPLALRVPETLGFVAMEISCFLIVKRRASAFYALVAFLFPAVTFAYYFSYEARPYGLVLGFCGLAAVCWQRAAEGRSRPASLIGLATFLACAINCHYYAVLLILPFGFAEIARLVLRRRVDLSMAAALLAPALSLTFSVSLIRAASRYSGHFWEKPHWTNAISFYEDLLRPTGFALALILLFAGASAWRSAQRNESSVNRYFPVNDIAMALGFVLLPAASVTLAMFVTHAYTLRYAIYAVFGLSILVAAALAQIGRNRALVGFISAAVLLGCMAVIAFRQYQQLTGNQQMEANTFKFLSSCCEELPLIINSPQEFFLQSHRAALNHKGHFVYLADVPLAVKYTETDDVERGLIALSKYAPLDVRIYGSFLANHSEFLVYGFSEPFGWVLKDLIHKGWTVTVKARNGDTLLYLVSWPSRYAPLAVATAR